MKVPIVHGIIDRRILVNFRVVPEVLEKILPRPFRPKLVSGWGMAGICLIRLRQIRPHGVPGGFGISSENAAHRIAVRWERDGQSHEGVFIPRRDTSSAINALAGGRIFPGSHHRSEFRVAEPGEGFHIRMRNQTDGMHLSLRVRFTDALPATSVFRSLHDASEFFRRGAVGYSVTPCAGEFDGLELRSRDWRVEPLAVEHVESSFFADESLFPQGAAAFDCALLMRNIPHEWIAKEPLFCREEDLWETPRTA